MRSEEHNKLGLGRRGLEFTDLSLVALVPRQDGKRMWECVLGYHHDPRNSYHQLIVPPWSPSYPNIFAMPAFESSPPPNRHSSYPEERRNTSDAPREHSSDTSSVTKAEVVAYGHSSDDYSASHGSVSIIQPDYPPMSRCATLPSATAAHNIPTSPLGYPNSLYPAPSYNLGNFFSTPVVPVFDNAVSSGTYQPHIPMMNEGRSQVDDYLSMAGQGFGHASGEANLKFEVSETCI